MFSSPGSRATAGNLKNYIAIPRGSVTNWLQAAAPRGWTRVTTNDDALMRIVGTATPGTGGSNGFVATFNSQTGTGTGTTGGGTTGTGTSGATALSIAQMPAHTHGIVLDEIGPEGTAAVPLSGSQTTVLSGATASAGSGGTHTHTVPGLSVPGLSVPSLSITTAIKYVDSLIASKN
jgi:hypothetical protein